MTWNATTEALDLAFRVLTAPPPDIGADLALALATSHYGWGPGGTITQLSGERDRNFRLDQADREPLTLKFINPAEPEAETDMQVSALHHLVEVGCPIAVPQAVATLGGTPGFTWAHAGTQVRGRAYTFLDGMSAVHAPTHAAFRRAVGRTVAEIDIALQDFQHPAVERVFPWDLMHLEMLRPLAHVLREDTLRSFILDFLDRYQSSWAPRLATLPQQVIHGDLSKSNLLVDPRDPSRVKGVLDFGDMVCGPAIADLAITASYHMDDAEDPVAALAEVVEGHAVVRPLTEKERGLLPILVMARLVQRIVIPEWRAAQFPENRAYILRSNTAARQLLESLLPNWTSMTGATRVG
ncbi:MAG: phosphotransferase [Xenophilus sp.]